MGPGGSMLEQPKSLELKADLYAALPTGSYFTRTSSTFMPQESYFELDTKKGEFQLTNDEDTLKHAFSLIDKLKHNPADGGACLLVQIGSPENVRDIKIKRGKIQYDPSISLYKIIEPITLDWKINNKYALDWSEEKLEKELPQPAVEEIIEKTSAPVFAPQPIAPASLENEFDALEYFSPRKIEELAGPMLVENRRVQYIFTSAPGPQINVRILIDQEPEIVEFLITKSEVEQAQSEKDILATLKKRIPLINSIVEMMLSGEGQKLDKDQEENPFKFFLARRIGMRSQNLYFPKTHEAYIPNLEELNTAMGQGNETGKYVIYFQTEENELEATKVVAFTTNGLFLQIENFDEVRQNGRINVNDKKAKFFIISRDGFEESNLSAVVGRANSLGEAQSLLQQEAEKLIEFQLDEFYNEVETSKLNLMQSTGGTQGEKETYLREKEKERIFDVGLVSIDRANLKQKITESANNKPHQEYYQNLLAELEKDPLEFYKKLAQEQRQPVHQRVVQIIENIKSNYQRKVEGLN